MANEADVESWVRLCLAKIGTKEAFTSSCYWETGSNIKLTERATCTDSNRHWIKDKNIWRNNNNHLLLWILAVFGRYGSHLLMVVIFLTQNNFFKRSRNFRPSPWILPVFRALINSLVGYWQCRPLPVMLRKKHKEGKQPKMAGRDESPWHGLLIDGPLAVDVSQLVWRSKIQTH